MHKIIYIDVGTHFGQEYQSIFGSHHYFFYKIIRRLIGYYILRKGDKLQIKTILQLFQLRSNLRVKKNYFEFYFIEANPKIINHSNVYKQANAVFNVALTNEKKIDIVKLYVANNNYMGQGNSILKEKYNISINEYIPTIGIPSLIFFENLSEYLKNLHSKYKVILRLNCEGVEDDVIYAAHKVFCSNLVLTMGSLKDVEETKGHEAYLNLKNFLNKSNLQFVPFKSSVITWLDSFKSILTLFKTK